MTKDLEGGSDNTDIDSHQRPWEYYDPPIGYISRYRGCPLCEHDGFDAGWIDLRIKRSHWPKGAREPDLSPMRQELIDQFDLDVEEKLLKEHWELHVTHGFRDTRK